MSSSPVNQARAQLARELADAFARFGPAFMRWIRARQPEDAPTFARMRLLKALEWRGPQIMNALSDDLGVTPRNVTALVDGLEAEGLVRRLPHPADRRATIVELTRTGKSRCGRTFEEHRAGVAELFEDLSVSDQRELLRLMNELVEGLRRRGASQDDHEDDRRAAS